MKNICSECLWSAYIDEKVADEEIGEAMTARLKERYQHEVVPQLRHTYAYQNPHEVPRLTKIDVFSRDPSPERTGKRRRATAPTPGRTTWPP